MKCYKKIKCKHYFGDDKKCRMDMIANHNDNCQKCSKYSIFISYNNTQKTDIKNKLKAQGKWKSCS